MNDISPRSGKVVSPWAPVSSDKGKLSVDTPGPKVDPVMHAYDAWKTDSSKENASLLVRALEPTIASALNTYAPGMERELAVRAKLLSLDAAQTYNPKMGTHLKTHVFTTLKRLSRLGTQRSNTIKLPDNVQAEKKALERATAEFKAENGREPTREELADKTGISIRRMGKLEARYPSAYSEGSLLSEKGDSLFTGKKDPYKVWVDYVYYDLSPRDKKIFEWSTGYGGTKKISKGEIARRLGLSNSAISRRVNYIISELERGYSLGNGN